MNPDIKGKRLKLGLTLEEVGDLVGVGKSTVRKWETGDIENMKRDKIVKLAKALRVSPAFIMGMEEESKQQVIEAVSIPVVSQISAGEPLYSEENILEYSYAPTNILKSSHDYFYLKVTGDSMNKEFNEGDLLLIEKDAPIENGQIGIVQFNGYEATVKRVRYDEDKVYLIPESTNAEHLPRVYNKEDDIHFIGRVVMATSQKIY